MVRHRVFIGSSSEALKKAKWLQELLFELRPNEVYVVGWWEDGVFPPDKTFIEALFEQLKRTDSALLLATEEDKLDHRGKSVYRPRDNIILEYGLWSGKFGRKKTALAILGSPELPSDLAGMANLKLIDETPAENFKARNRSAVRAWLESFRKPAGGPGKVFFLFPSLRDDPFYLDLLAGLAGTFPSRYDLTVCAPREAYNAEQFIIELREISRHRDAYVGGIIRPVLAGQAGDEVRKTVENWTIPTVFTDVNAFESDSMPPHVCYVGFDNRQGGRLAAQAMSYELQGKPDSRVLVVASNEQPERRDAFLEALNVKTEPHVEHADFKRAEASNRVRKAFKHAERPFDGIFCSSDVMALGAIAAVTELFSVDPMRVKDIVIIGYDGTPTARTLIDLRDNPFRNTVMQDSYVLGRGAAALLEKMMSGESLRQEERVQTLPVEMYIARGDSAPKT